MHAAPLRDDEPGSLAALRALDVLDTAAEPEFDALVRVAAIACRVPIALISLIDAERQWFKAGTGLPGVAETARDVSFCAHAVLADALFEVTDAAADPRFADNPLVTGEPGIRFYAGAPVVLGDGYRVGTLCVIDHQPRALDDTQRELLRCLAVAVARALEGRRAERALRQERERLANIIEGTGVGTWEWNVRTGELRINARYAEMVGRGPDEADRPSHVAAWRPHIHPDDLAHCKDLLKAHFERRSDRYACDLRLRHRDGHWVWAAERGRVMSWGSDGAPEWMFGTRRDISLRKQQEDALRKSEAFLDRTGRLAGVGGWELDLASGVVTWSDETRRLHGVAPDYQPTLATAIEFYAPEARPAIQAAVEQGVVTGRGWDLELQLIRADGRLIWARAVGAVETEAGRPVRLVGSFQDITEMHRLRSALEQINRQQAAMLDNDLVGIVRLHNRIVVWKNRAQERIFGYAPDELIGQPIRLLYADDEAYEALGAAAYPVLQTGQHYRTQLQMRRKNGELIWIDLSGVLLSAQDGESLWLMADITPMKQYQQQVEHIAFHDALTGLPNRLLLSDRLNQALHMAQRQGYLLAVAYLDLDGFKQVNDQHGHAAGDRLLREVAQRLRRSVRVSDTVARLGGDEFVLVLAPVASRHECQLVLERLLVRLKTPITLDAQITARVAGSIGVAFFPDDAQAANRLLTLADEAMFDAKRGGRSRIRFHGEPALPVAGSADGGADRA
ncbi:MAG: diguanylate cyclase [Leptothrix sp. (in: b-proteobacteria)]